MGEFCLKKQLFIFIDFVVLCINLKPAIATLNAVSNGWRQNQI